MKKTWILTLAFLLVLVSCSKDSDSEVVKEELPQGTIVGLPDDTDDYYVESIYGKEEVENGKFDSSLDGTNDGDSELVLFFLKNSKGKVVMMARDLDESGKNLVINSETTALALITMHPFFAMLPENEFSEMSDLIKSQASFSTLKASIESVISSDGYLLSEDNTEIASALEDVFNELQKILDDNQAESEANSKAFSGPQGIYVDCDPIDIKAHGNRLDMRVLGLAPTYNGCMYDNDGVAVHEFEIPTRADYGFLDLFTKTQSNWKYGETVTTQFPGDGEFRFIFKADLGNLFAYMVSYGIDMIGGSKLLKAKWGIDVNDLTEYTYDRLVSYYSSLAAPGEMGAGDWIGIVYGGVSDYLESTVTLDNGKAAQAVAVVQTIAKATNVYFKAKTIGNFGGRLMGWLRADKEIEFTLCCYENEVTNCDALEERQLLIEFYENTNGDEWTNNTNWCTSKPVSEWFGVQVDEDGHVVSIELPDNNLSGKAEFKEGFVSLRKINVDDNPELDNITLDNPGLTEVTIKNSCSHGLIYNWGTKILRLSDIEPLTGVLWSHEEEGTELHVNNVYCSSSGLLTGKVDKLYVTDYWGGYIGGSADYAEIKDCELDNIGMDNATTLNVTNCVLKGSVGGSTKKATITGCRMYECGINSEELYFINSTTTNYWYANTSHKAVFSNSHCSVVCGWDFSGGCSISVSNTYLFQPDWNEEASGTYSFTCTGATWSNLFEGGESPSR